MRIELMGVSKIYDAGRTEALCACSVAFEQGDYVSVRGRSGSGKTTLLAILGLLLAPTSGRVVFGSRSVDELSQRELARFRSTSVGFVFQNFNLIAGRSSLENVALGLLYQPNSQRSSALSRAEQVLASVGLEKRKDHNVENLSGGEQQRVAIARAIARGPQVVLCDEPTGNLDSQTAGHVVSLLETFNEAGTTLIVATHDSTLAERAKRRLTIEDGYVVEQA